MKIMKWRRVLGSFALVLAVAVAVSAGSALIQMQGSATAQSVTVSEKATVVESPFTQAVRDVRDSVVGVNNYGLASRTGATFGYFGRGFGGYSAPDDSENNREILQGSGSGVVIAQGYVITNQHVIEGSTSLEVVAGEKSYAAALVASDEMLDIAVLRVDGLALKPVVLGDSDMLNVGDWAICIGNPLSFSGTTTVGVISALNREVTNETRDAYGRRTENVNAMIQTDAAINAGNSGGGMFNVAGELVGIPSMKYTSSYYSTSTVEGIGMAIPINEAKALINEALQGAAQGAGAKPAAEAPEETPAAAKPRIGVTVTNVDTSSNAVASGALPVGAYVAGVEAGSPAEKAGILVGDIIVEIDGNVITTSSEMVSALQDKQAGESASMKVFRVTGLDASQNPTGNYIDMSVELAMLDAVQ